MNMYNPMLDYQRNNLLAQQQMIQNQLNQMPQSQATFNPYPQPQYFIKQVGSMEEVRGFPIDPNVIYLFPDTGTGKIYLKKLNTDNGKSEVYVYTPSQEGGESVVEESSSNDIIKRLDTIDERIGGLYESVSRLSSDARLREESHRDYADEHVEKDAKPKSSKIQSDRANAQG